MEGTDVVGAWDAHHGTLDAPLQYGADTTYRMAADALHGCMTVEDWGCGGGAFRRFLDPWQYYLGVDGSETPFAGIHADLRYYRSSHADGILLRHVLEHNYEWRTILANAVASYQRTLVVVLFTVLADETHTVLTEPDYGDVPVIAFRLGDLLARIDGEVDVHVVESPDTAYGVETVLTVRR